MVLVMARAAPGMSIFLSLFCMIYAQISVCLSNSFFVSCTVLSSSLNRRQWCSLCRALSYPRTPTDDNGVLCVVHCPILEPQQTAMVFSVSCTVLSSSLNRRQWCSLCRALSYPRAPTDDNGVLCVVHCLILEPQQTTMVFSVSCTVLSSSPNRRQWCSLCRALSYPRTQQTTMVFSVSCTVLSSSPNRRQWCSLCRALSYPRTPTDDNGVLCVVHCLILELQQTTMVFSVSCTVLSSSPNRRQWCSLCRALSYPRAPTDDNGVLCVVHCLILELQQTTMVFSVSCTVLSSNSNRRQWCSLCRALSYPRTPTDDNSVLCVVHCLILEPQQTTIVFSVSCTVLSSNPNRRQWCSLCRALSYPRAPTDDNGVLCVVHCLILEPQQTTMVFSVSCTVLSSNSNRRQWCSLCRALSYPRTPTDGNGVPCVVHCLILEP